MIYRKQYRKFFVPVALAVMLIFMILPVIAGATPWNNEEEHPQRFWDSKRPNPAAMVMDTLFVRPIALAATITGGLCYFISLPFSTAGDNSDDVWNQLVIAPARTTFSRPVGVFYLDDEVDTGGMPVVSPEIDSRSDSEVDVRAME